MSKMNRYGIDIEYFGREFDRLKQSLPNRPASELARYLHTLGNILSPDDATVKAEERVRVLETNQLELQHNVMAIRKEERAATERANMLEAGAMQGAEERNSLRERISMLECSAGGLVYAIDHMRMDYGVPRDVEDSLEFLRNALTGGKEEG